jgi:hypothetical protein
MDPSDLQNILGGGGVLAGFYFFGFYRFIENRRIKEE